MATTSDDDQQMRGGAQLKQEATHGNERSARDELASKGATGEGSGSALARMISQEQARIIPGAPNDAPTGGSSPQRPAPGVE